VIYIYCQWCSFYIKQFNHRHYTSPILLDVSMNYLLICIQKSLYMHQIVSVRKNPKEQSRMDSPETMVTLRTQNTERRQTKQK
jgi:hypothetical protein